MTCRVGQRVALRWRIRAVQQLASGGVEAAEGVGAGGGGVGGRPGADLMLEGEGSTEPAREGAGASGEALEYRLHVGDSGGWLLAGRTSGVLVPAPHASTSSHLEWLVPFRV